MFDLAWTEILVIAIVLIVVVGPKDLPKMLRTFGKMMGKMTAMAGDFRKQFDEAMREAELDEVRKTIDSAKSLNPASELKKALNPMEKAAQDVRSGLDTMMKKDSSAKPAADTATAPSEPAKTGATALPGEGVQPQPSVEAKPASALKPNGVHSGAEGEAKPVLPSGGAGS